jgi:hypothetical protein
LDKKFCVNLATEVPHRAIHDLFNNQAWMIFNVYNVAVIKRGVKFGLYEDCGISFQNYLFELLEDCDAGYIQLYSLPKIARCDGCVYRQFSLMQISVFRNCASRKISPLVITVKAKETERVCVPLIPGQHLQVITSFNSIVDFSDPLSLVGNDDKTLCNNGGRITSTTFRCENLLTRGELVSISHNKRRSAIWLPGIMVTDDGDLYPYLNSSECKTHLISHNMAGFAITNVTPEEEWLCDDFVNFIESDVGKIIKFTKPQKSVIIEKNQGFWLLEAGQTHSLETL